MSVSYTHLDVYKRQPLHREPAVMTGKGIIPALQLPAPGREVFKGKGRVLSAVDDDEGRFRGHGCLSRACVYRGLFSQKMCPMA